MKFITAFFMAWGNFIVLPCPYKRWDGTLKNRMLAFLPSVGVVIGLLWMALLWALAQLAVPVLLAAFILMFYPFAVCGFMHMDGFMDCNDAIMSRRPLEERQRILKDSTVGAFAVVTVCFLLLAWFTAMSTAVYKLGYAELLLLPVISRGISGLSVLTCRPLGHSQYAEDFQMPGRGRYRAAVFAQMALVVVVCAVFGSHPARLLICAAVTAAAAFLACAYARRQLGGMSGDIAGYAICVGELAGIITLAVL